MGELSRFLRPLALLYLCCLEPLFVLLVLFTEFPFAIPRYFFISIIQAWMVEAPVFCPNVACVCNTPLIVLYGGK